MKNTLLLYSCVLLAVACGRGKKETPKSYISIVSLVKRQVNAVDSNFGLLIKKIVITDSAHSDTTVISREQFNEEAKAFLNIPDLSLAKVAKLYKEETASYDNMMNRVIIAYSAIKPEEEYKTQQMLVIPDNAAGDKVSNIMATSEISGEKGIIIRKNLLWQLDKSFQVTTTTLKNGEPDQSITTKVIWSEGDQQ